MAGPRDCEHGQGSSTLKFSMRRPDDFHVHLRDGGLVSVIGPHTAATFARALVMPNTSPPVLIAGDAASYGRQICEEVPGLFPLMTIQLTGLTTPAAIREASQSGVTAAKFYPIGVTTNSENGALDLLDLEDALDAMEACGMILCIHGETPGEFCMDREKVFLKRTLMPLSKSWPNLKIVLEHVSTEDAVGFVESLPDNVAATITVHHLYLTLDDVVGERLKPHSFCKPLAKRPQDRKVLRAAATSGNPKFFLGTDSAPHSVDRKECAHGCAGVFSAPVAMEALIQAFEEEDALPKLEAFTSEYGARFYGLPLNEGKVGYVKKPWQVPYLYDRAFVPFMAGETLDWSKEPA